MKYLFSTLLFVLLTTLSQSQTQIGNDIDGEAQSDLSGGSVSMPDVNNIAIGAHKNNGTGPWAGHVRIYSWNGNNWTQKGNDINGESHDDLSGWSVSMPDSNIVAIGAPRNGGNGLHSGHVRIFSWNGNNWTQKGNDIDGEANNDESGHSVSMPDSNTVAIGARGNDGSAFNAGHVRIFSWNGNNWTQKGNDIDGEAVGDQSGNSVSMPDSNTVAIGAVYNNGGGTYSGHVRIYSWNGNNWTQKGNDIDGDAAGDNSGYSVSMPDPNTVAIGAPYNNGSGIYSGHVKIYSWDGNNWTQKGNDIDGQVANEQSGRSVSMPDSNIVAIGAPYSNGGGHVRVYSWDGNSWLQIGYDIDAEGSNDDFGKSISMSSKNTIAIGAPGNNNGNGSNAGHVRVYCSPSTNTISATTCTNYTSPSGNYTWTTSGTYEDTITNATGCDSIITVNLTVNQNTTANISPAFCDSFTSPSSNHTWTASGIYMDTISNNVGCDSIITVNLTIDQSTTSSISPVICDSFTSPSGNYTWTTSGTYTDTIQNSIGCDSIIMVNLVNQSSNVNISPIVCDSYTSPSGNYTWTTSGTYMDTIPNTLGCDSIITVNLTVKNNIGSQNETVCNSYTWPVNNQTYTSSGNYTTTLTNSAGCDSVVTLNLTVNDSSSSTISTVVCDNYTSPSGNYNWTLSGTYMDTIQNAEGCDSLITVNLTVNQSTTSSTSPVVCNDYTSPSGNYTWITSGIYQDTISNSVGCDSVITIHLNVDSINTAVQNSGDSLIAQDTGATYQWINCDNNSTPIPGETGQILEVAASGDYAVSLTKHGCIDTSACYNVIPSGFETAISDKNNIIVYPNPNEGLFTIEHSFTERKPFEVTNINGKILYSGTLTQKQTKVDLSNFATGIYLLRIEGAVVKLVLK